MKWENKRQKVAEEIVVEDCSRQQAGIKTFCEEDVVYYQEQAEKG